MAGFGGINAGVSRVDLGETESPDASNCFFHDGRAGVLGQRKGKTFLNSTAFVQDVTGYVPFLLPSGTQRIQVATNNGEVIQTSANNPTGVTTYLTGNAAVGKAMTTSSLVLSHPDTTTALNTTFSDSSTYDPQLSIFVSWGFGITLSSGAWTTAKKLRLEFGVNENGTAHYLFTFDWTMQFDHAWVFTGLTPAAMHNAADTITGMCARISWPDGWPAGAAGGDSVTLSSLLMG